MLQYKVFVCSWKTPGTGTGRSPPLGMRRLEEECKHKTKPQSENFTQFDPDLPSSVTPEPRSRARPGVNKPKNCWPETLDIRRAARPNMAITI